MVKSPILLIAFNRPDTTTRVLEEIARQKPSQLFVACDAPRSHVPEDRERVDGVKKAVTDIVTWDCELHTFYPEDNLGLKRGVVGAIDWFFDHVTEGIILEDDCLPHPDFFGFCDELLERYRDDQRVWAIQGDNSLKMRLRGAASYGFIPHALIWGWATWKRAWKHYDGELTQWQKIRGTKEVTKLWPDRIERKIRSELLDKVLQDPDFTWDYQWAFTVSYHRGLTVVPRKNLVSNIGWDRADATHTTGPGSRANAPTFPLLPVTHPATVRVDKRATSDALNGRLFGAGKHRVWWRVKKALRQKIRTLRQ